MCGFSLGAAGARLAATVLTASALALPAVAHVTLERKEAPVGASYKAVLRVPARLRQLADHRDPRPNS